jgi:hypothetical protein
MSTEPTAATLTSIAGAIGRNPEIDGLLDAAIYGATREERDAAAREIGLRLPPQPAPPSIIDLAARRHGAESRLALAFVIQAALGWLRLHAAESMEDPRLDEALRGAHAAALGAVVNARRRL